MANNRMWLINERLGVRVLLAKFYPSTGWFVPHDGLRTVLDTAFDLDESTSQEGSTDWRISYESAESPELLRGLRVVTSEDALTSAPSPTAAEAPKPPG
jgi:hypothetical protein